MNIQFNITEDEIRAIAEESVKKYIDEAVAKVINEEFREKGYNSLMRELTPNVVREISALIKVDEKHIINKVAEKIAYGLNICSTDVVMALLSMTKESED